MIIWGETLVLKNHSYDARRGARSCVSEALNGLPSVFSKAQHH